MAIDKLRKRAQKAHGRDGGGFVAIPWVVLDCAAYKLLSHPARSLLMEIARQYVIDNNGRLLASGKYLSERGWRSADVIHRAKRELIDAGFIYETVRGYRPNKASWYAITWQNLDKLHGYDAGVLEGWRDARSGYAKSNFKKIKKFIPPDGLNPPVIAPSSGVSTSTPAPSGGAILDPFTHFATPPNGSHLEIPSITPIRSSPPIHE